MSIEENKAIVRRYLEEFWVKGNVDRLEELFHPSYFRKRGRPGLEQAKQGHQAILDANTDLGIDIHEVVAEGNKVVAFFTRHGLLVKRLGSFVPTGKPWQWVGVGIYYIEDGKIVDSWGQSDILGLYKQSGVTPDMDQVNVRVWGEG